MHLIEVGADKFINVAQICSVKIETYEKTKRGEPDYGQIPPAKKIGESSTLHIRTCDGEEHRVEDTEKYFEGVYAALFPDRTE